MEQEVGVRGGEERDMNRQKAQQGGGGQVQPQQSQPQNCPRCNSLNTKFCYYNNYSLLQPRYFCKACKRHWTQGGTLRNVPVGGSSSKGKRAKNSSSSQLQQSQPPPSPSEEVVQTQQPNLMTMVNTTDPSPMVASSIIDRGGST